MNNKKIAIASDHAGFELKQDVKRQLQEKGYEVLDHGPQDDGRVDYPDYAALVAKTVSGGDADLGVLVCGSGIGMAITANKFKGIRAASIVDTYSAEMARKHNDLNVLCLGARTLEKEKEKVFEILNIFLNTEFEGGRHAERVAKIAGYEKRA